MIKLALNFLRGFRKKIASEHLPQKEHAIAFTGDLKKDEALVRKTFTNCGDVVYRSLRIPALGNREALVVLVMNLVNRDIVNRDIMARLMESVPEEKITQKKFFDLISASEISLHKSIDEVNTQVLQGKVLILCDGVSEALLVETRQSPARAVEEPAQERIIQGPREGFTEVLTINIALIRRRLPTPSLKMEFISIGRRTVNKVALIFLDDVADLNVAEEVRGRLKAIDIDGILEPGTLGELIADRKWSPFPLLQNTERPDKVVGELMQGKVIVFADGSPFAKIMPTVFGDLNQSPEDFYIHPIYATMFRLLRFAGFFAATTITAAYTAIVSFHYEMIPQEFVVFIAEKREGVPFIPFIEALFLEFSVDLIREASLRLPGPIGGTIGIVGALILGQAVISAGLVSPVLLVIVALSFMASFTIPNYEASLAVRLLRYPMLIAAGFL